MENVLAPLPSAAVRKGVEEPLTIPEVVEEVVRQGEEVILEAEVLSSLPRVSIQEGITPVTITRNRILLWVRTRRTDTAHRRATARPAYLRVTVAVATITGTRIEARLINQTYF